MEQGGTGVGEGAQEFGGGLKPPSPPLATGLVATPKEFKVGLVTFSIFNLHFISITLLFQASS